VASYAGGNLRFSLPDELHAGLVGVARRHNVTVFMVLQAGLAALLSRLGAGADIPLGGGVAGRTDEALDELVGLFVNTLVLRTDTSGDPTFAELLGRVRETSLGAYAHQDVPFEHLVEVLNPQRSAGYHPLFQVALVLQNTPRPTFALGGLVVEPVFVGTGTARFDLLFSLTEMAGESGEVGGVAGSVEFATDLFDGVTVDLLVRRWVRLLGAVVADPGVRIGDVDVVLEGERPGLLAGTGTGAIASADAGVGGAGVSVEPVVPVDLASLVAGRDPGAFAVVSGDRWLTYGELEEWANRLAHWLRARGVGVESRVALVLPRSVELVVAVLAVAKTGGVFVPVDPAYPVERREFMLADAGAVVVLDGVLPDVSGLPGSAPAVGVPVDAGAYVIYTSGSTGVPKGVVVSHRGVAALGRALVAGAQVSSGSRVLLLASPSFDASVLELVMAWSAGAVLVVAPVGVVGGELAGVIADGGVTHALVPPSLLATVPVEGLEGFGSLLVGGEACGPELVERWAQGRRMVNAYGPTESTVVVSMSEPLAADGGGSGRVPIGRPVAGTRVYVLDERLRPVPPGVVG
ncbi:non-ribosomal peptide synthetase, partial [Nonomuraea jabiensis]